MVGVQLVVKYGDPWIQWAPRRRYEIIAKIKVAKVDGVAPVAITWSLFASRATLPEAHLFSSAALMSAARTANFRGVKPSEIPPPNLTGCCVREMVLFLRVLSAASSERCCATHARRAKGIPVPSRQPFEKPVPPISGTLELVIFFKTR